MAYYNNPGKAQEYSDEMGLNFALRPIIEDAARFKLNRPQLFPKDASKRQQINKYLNSIAELPFNYYIFLGKVGYNSEHYRKDIAEAQPVRVVDEKSVTRLNTKLSTVVNKLLDYGKKHKLSDAQTTTLIYAFVDKFFENQLNSLAELILQQK